MYKLLNEEELKIFVDNYFKEWGKDIKKASVVSYNGIDEYLINDAVLFIKK